MNFSEDTLIQTHFRKAAFSPYALELQDDAACFPVPEGQELVITCDTIVEHVHFFSDDPVGAIAQKALRVNLSDLAAKGAIPAGFFLSLALPKNCFQTVWLHEFSQALTEDAILFNCPLLGGDTTRSKGHIVITITAIGLVPTGKMVKRTTAHAGDILYVTGTIGDAGVGLLQYSSSSGLTRGSTLDKCPMDPRLKAEDDGVYLNSRRLIPHPRVEIAPLLQEYATAALDISDGFAGDCMKLLSFSKLGVSINCEDVPLSGAIENILPPCGGAVWRSQTEGGENTNIEVTPPSASLRSAAPPQGGSSGAHSLYPTILSGGDDYELLFTIAPAFEAEFLHAAQNLPFPVTRLAVVNASGVVEFLLNGEALELEKVSYSHI